MHDDPFKDQMITHKRRYYNETSTIRSQHTISEKDCRDLTKINRQRKHEGFDRSLTKVKLCRNRLKGQCCSLPKKRTREVVLQSRLCKGQTRAGRVSVLWKGLRRRSCKGQTWAGRGRVLGRVCEEGRKVDSQLQSRIRLHVPKDSFLIYNCVPRKLKRHSSQNQMPTFAIFSTL